MKISEKLKEVLKPEDIQVIEESIETVITERVALKEDEIKKKQEIISEEFVAKKVAEETENIKKTLTEEKEAEIQKLESMIVEKLDAFLENEVVAKIPNEVITEMAKIQLSMPIVEGIKKLFAEQYLELDSTGSDLLKQAKDEIEKLTESNDTLIAEKNELAITAEKAATTLLIKDKTVGLDESQVQRVRTILEGKSFDEAHEKIDSIVEMIIDEQSKVENKRDENLNENTDPTSDADGLKPTKKQDYNQAVLDAANRLFK